MADKWMIKGEEIHKYVHDNASLIIESEQGDCLIESVFPGYKFTFYFADGKAPSLIIDKWTLIRHPDYEVDVLELAKARFIQIMEQNSLKRGKD